jgi:hypothetical protein
MLLVIRLVRHQPGNSWPTHADLSARQWADRSEPGAHALAGEADQIALNGIDRWIGGVHLHGHEAPWRWEDGTESIVRLA